MFGCVCTIAFCVVWWSCVALISCQVCFRSGRRRVVVERSGGEWWRRVSLRSVAEERCRQTNVVEKCWRKYKELTLLLLAVWASPTNLSIQTWTLKRSGCISHCFAELLSNGDHPGYMTQLHTLDLFNSRLWAASDFFGYSSRDNLIQDTLALKEAMVFPEGLQLLDLPDHPSHRSQNTLDQSLWWHVAHEANSWQGAEDQMDANHRFCMDTCVCEMYVYHWMLIWYMQYTNGYRLHICT